MSTMDTSQQNETLSVRDVWRYARTMLKRPLRALGRYLFFREEMEVLLQRFSARCEATGTTVAGSAKFSALLKSTYPRIAELFEQVGVFFDREAGPNYIGLLLSDPQAQRPELYEVIIRKTGGLTATEVAARQKRGLIALANADVRKLEKAGIPTAVFVQMILATCHQSPPPIKQQIPFETIFKIADPGSELSMFLEFYNAWLRSGQTL